MNPKGFEKTPLGCLISTGLLLLVSSPFLFLAWFSLSVTGRIQDQREKWLACQFHNPLTVLIGEHALSISAAERTEISRENGARLRAKLIGSSLQSEGSLALLEYGFCLEKRAPGSVVAYAVSMQAGQARWMSAEVGLPTSNRVRLGVSGIIPQGLKNAPPPDPNTQIPEHFVLYRSVPERGWNYYVSEGVSEQGFRIEAWCDAWDWAGDRRCSLSIEDQQQDLFYSYRVSCSEAKCYDGPASNQPASVEFFEIADKMREMVRLLETRE